MSVKMLLTALLLLVGFSASIEAQTVGEIEARIGTVQAKREKLFAEFRAAELMLKLAPLEDEKLRAEESALKAKLEQFKGSKKD